MTSIAGDHLGFGCVGLSSMRSSFLAGKILERAYALGIRHFDTAPLYGHGYSELLLKNLLKKKKRNSVCVATKFGLKEPGLPALPAFMALPLNHLQKGLGRTKINRSSSTFVGNKELQTHEISVRKLSAGDIKSGLENSLKRLGTDYIDYYFLHEGLPSFLTEEAMNYLLKQKSSGVIRNIGVAANSEYLLNMKSEEMLGWEALQYEENNVLNVQKLMLSFPKLKHFHHSCFKNVKSETLSNGLGGSILAKSAQINEKGKILFSTRNILHLQQNVCSFERFMESWKQE